MTDVVNGTTVGVSASLPATFDATGYDALTFTTVGNVIDSNEVAVVDSIVEHQTLALNYPEKIKGTYNIPNLTLTIAKTVADAGQVIVKAGKAATTSYSLKFVYPSTNQTEVTGKIIKASPGPLAANNIETMMVEVAIDPQSVFES